MHRWIITIAGDHEAAETAAALTALGVTDTQVHDAIGVIVCAAEEDVMADVRALSGVVDVSPERQVDVGPPDAPIS